MPGPGFGRADLPAADGRHVVGRQRDFDDLGTGVAQSYQATLEGARHRGVQAVEHIAQRQCQAQRAQRPAAQRHAARCRHLVQQDCVAHAAGDGAGGVEREGQWQASFIGRQRLGVLEAHETVQRSRHADRAARVRAQRGPGGPGRHRDRAAGGRAAGDARRGVQRQRAGIGRRAMVRIDADAGEGELGQVGVAEQRRAGARAGVPPPGCRRWPAPRRRSTSRPPCWARRPRRTDPSTETASPASGGTGGTRCALHPPPRRWRAPWHRNGERRHGGMLARWQWRWPARCLRRRRAARRPLRPLRIEGQRQARVLESAVCREAHRDDCRSM